MEKDFEETTEGIDIFGRPQKPDGLSMSRVRRFSANSNSGLSSGRVAEEIGHRGQFESFFPQFGDHPGEALGGMPAAAIGIHDDDRAIPGPALHGGDHLFGRHPEVGISGHHIPLDVLEPQPMENPPRFRTRRGDERGSWCGR